MSFICQVCHKYGTIPVRVVTQYEPCNYPERRDAKGLCVDKGGEGHRIVSEVNAHSECAGKVAAPKPASRRVVEEAASTSKVLTAALGDLA